MQINYIHETRFKYVLRCSSRRIYDFLLEICFLEMMRSHEQMKNLLKIEHKRFLNYNFQINVKILIRFKFSFFRFQF